MPHDIKQLGKGAADRREDYFGPRAWRHDEIAAAFQPAVWAEKKLADFITYPKRNQMTQSSCVTYVLGKQLAIDELSENGMWRELSPRSLYPYVRVEGGGANSVIATKLACKQGMTLEHLLKSDGLSEAEMSTDKGYATDAKQVGFVYKPKSYIECSADFETIASIIYAHRQAGQKKGVAITLIGENNGSWLTAFPTAPKNPNIPDWYHRVIVTDFGLVNGKKTLAFDNSWGEAVGNKGQQFLTQEYEPYIYGGIYTLNQPDDWQQSQAPVPMVHHVWTYDLSFGMKGNEVLVLQQALQSMGFFPVSDLVKPTGNYFGVTQKAVELFQTVMMIPVTGVVDEKTREKLNGIFGV